MKEIKFRAWAYASGKMFYPSTDDGWELINGKLQPLPNTTLMQYTGLKDKNGKEIYEGDIWETPHGNKGIVIFRNGAFDFTDITGQIPTVSYEYEVIGNIYENPERLEELEK